MAKSLADEFVRISTAKKHYLNRIERKPGLTSPTSLAAQTLDNNRLYLGSHIPSDCDMGEKFDGVNGIHIKDDVLTFDKSTLNHHMFVIGATGMGKSQTVFRLVKEAVDKGDTDVLFVDGKGEYRDALALANIAYSAGLGKVPIFTLGYEVETSSVYNGFEGTNKAICNRLSEMANVLDAEGNARHYADRKHTLIQYICGDLREGRILNVEPPRSFDEIQERLSLSWLKNTYKGYDLILEDCKGFEKDKDITNLRIQFGRLRNSFSEIISDDGFSLNDIRCAVFSIKAMTAGVDARPFLSYLISDLNDFVSSRKDKDRFVLMIIDEFGAFGNENIVQPLALARGGGLGVVLLTQSIEALDSKVVRDSVNTNCHTFILMQNGESEELAEKAGNVLANEISSSLGEGGLATGAGSVRKVKKQRITKEDIEKLDKGEAFVISHGRAAKIKVNMVEEISTSEEVVDVVRPVEINEMDKETPPEKKEVVPEPKPKRKRDLSKFFEEVIE